MIEHILMLWVFLGLVGFVLTIGAILADWLEGQEWFIRWHRRNFR